MTSKIEEISKDNTEKSKTFEFVNEDHTLGNALRYVLMRNPRVDFCGYTVPHPSEYKMRVRLQTNGDLTANEVLKEGLTTLVKVCDHIDTTFDEAIKRKEES